MFHVQGGSWHETREGPLLLVGTVLEYSTVHMECTLVSNQFNPLHAISEAFSIAPCGGYRDAGMTLLRVPDLTTLLSGIDTIVLPSTEYLSRYRYLEQVQ